MKMALEEAEKAGRQGEVPVGAILVKGDRVIARDHNRCIELNDPTAHAEILVLRKAGESVEKLSVERYRNVCNGRTLSNVCLCNDSRQDIPIGLWNTGTKIWSGGIEI